jgi:hypothetical protein
MRKYHILIFVFILSGIATLFILGSKHESKSEKEIYFQTLPESREPKMAPNDWLAKQKLYPNPAFSYQHYLHALQQANALHKSSTLRDASWELAGPINIGGRITDLAIHPDNSTTIYVGAASGGIFKTVNNGMSWEHIFTDVPVISIGALAIDPQIRMYCTPEQARPMLPVTAL